MNGDSAITDEPVSFREAVRVWARIGLLSFGGPAGQIAVMHKELVEVRSWISEPRFLHALNYCMLLPGPEAQQLATYIGWLMHRTRGGLAAGLLFVLPGFVTILGLSVVYASFRELPIVAAVFFGLKAAVLAVVAEAVLRIGRRALKSRRMVVFAALAFMAIFFLGVPFPVIVLGAGGLGVLVARIVKTAVVTFGGAYAVLAYIAQRAVETYGWLRPGEMLDGLGMAETTPGPSSWSFNSSGSWAPSGTQAACRRSSLESSVRS